MDLHRREGNLASRLFPMPDTALSFEQIFGEAPFRHVLKNGLIVLCAPSHEAGLLSAQIWVKTGSMHEGDLLGSGLSHYLEHMVFKGTDKFSCRELTQIVQKAGGAMNAYTTFDRTVYHVDLPAEGAEVAVEVLAEMTLRAKISPEDAMREREVILREIDMRDDDPDSRLAEAVLEETFRAHPYRLPVIGLRPAFEKVTREQLFDYYKRRYVPNNMVLVVAGAVEPDQVVALAEKYFGSASASALGAVCIPEEPEQLARRQGELTGDVQVLRGCLAWRIPGMRHADAPALDVFSLLLGSGQSSRLFRRLHDELGLVHQIDGSNWTPGATGLLWLWYTADIGQRKAVEEAVRATVQEALQGGFSAEEFAKARRACLIAFLERKKTVSGSAGSLGAQEVLLGDLGYPRVYLEKIQTLTPETVLEAARRHIRDDKLTCLAMEPSAGEKAATAAKMADGPVPFEDTRLKNGLRVLLQPTAGFPKVHYRMLFLAGSATEPEHQRGIAALTATLLTRDTEKRSAGQVAEAAELVGASLQETAGNNSIGLAIEVLAGEQTLAHELLADAVQRPVFKEKTVTLEREAQRAALREEADDVVEFGRRRMRELFFGEHPFAVDYFGHDADLAKISSADARNWHGRWVTPENGVLAVSGAFDRDATLAELEKYFGDWSGAKETAELPLLGVPARTGRVEEVIPREQAVVFLAFPDAGITAEEFVTGQLVDELLSGMASRLFVTVREEQGLAYFVQASRISGLKEGLFYLYAGTSPEQVEPVVRAMQDEVARLRRGELDAEEIASAKTRLSVARRMARQTLGARAMNAGLNALYGLPVNQDVWWEEKLASLDAAAVGGFATRFFREENSLLYIVRPEANS